jgi:hypothetical protein
MVMSTLSNAGAMLLVATVLAGLGACSEKPQRVVSDGRGSYNLETGSALAERTRNQGESERIAY